MKFGIQALLSTVVIFSLMSLTGCGKKDVIDEELAVETVETETMGTPEPLDSPENSSMITEGRTSGPMLPVYFDFDASTIREDQVDRIVTNADFLKANTDLTIRIEGNCDARGTDEYNMALGERRAISAKKYLMDLGVPEDNMITVSFGEEKILNHGHDELAYAQNRRDDFVIVQ